MQAIVNDGLSSDLPIDVPPTVDPLTGNALHAKVSTELENETLVSPSSPLDLGPTEYKDQTIETVELADAECNEVDRELGETVATVHALEEYRELLKTAGVSGISPQTVKFLKVGLEHIETTTFDGQMSHALEHYDPKVEVVSLEDSIKDKIKSGIAKVIKLFKIWLDRIGTYYTNYKNGLNRLNSKVKTTRVKLDALEFVKDVEVKFMDTSGLSADGKSLVNDTSLITGLTQFITADYPDFLLATYKVIRDELNKADPERDDVGELVAKLNEELADITPEVPFNGVAVFPGNFRLKATKNSNYKLELDESLKTLMEHSYIITDKRMMELRLKNIEGILETLNKAVSRSKDLTNTVKQTQDSILKFMEKLAESDESTSTNLTALLSLLEDNKPSSEAVLTYLIKTVSQYLAVTEQEIRLMTEAKSRDE